MVELKFPIPKDFLQEGEIDGFFVGTEIRKTWAVEIDLLKELERVCNKYHLHYQAGAGTLLGAVRHKGFIPWDDDLDVYMLRDDYDRLMKVEYEFKNPYFLQTTVTEKNLFRSHAQLRNSNTTGFIASDGDRDINCGLFIDIFPIDGVSESQWRNSVQTCKDFILKKILGRYTWCNSLIERKGFFKLEQFFWKSFFRYFKKNMFFSMYDKNLKKYSKPGTKIWGNRTLVFQCPKSRRPYENWVDLCELPFEFTTIVVPKAYDVMLTQQYKNYMQIPKSKGVNFHGELTIDVDTPYKEYFKTHRI